MLIKIIKHVNSMQKRWYEVRMRGTGYCILVKESVIKIKIGLSIPIIIKIPKDLKIKGVSKKRLWIFGNESRCMAFMNNLKQIKRPDKYKGKGIYANNWKALRKERKSNK